jgi:hypothetical protein
MNRRAAIACAAVVVAIGTAVAVVVTRSSDSPSGTVTARPGAAGPSGLDPLVEEFRTTERTCIRRFNDALREQRENSIDELELSNTIERDVLVPWRAMRARVEAAPVHDELYTALRAYMEARQISWEAYVAALRAPDDAAARPHYDTHRAQNALAQQHAQKLGALFRAAAEKAGSGL